MPIPDVQLDQITKRFGTISAVRDVSLTVAAGEFLTLLGPSGCGKTTLLRTIGGFVSPDSGTVRIRGEAVGDIPPHQRPTAMVFQRYALFPHLNVAANVGYGLRMQRLPRPEIAQRVAEMLDLVDLAGFEGRMPDDLSGGQQQRVALARALVLHPAVLLLDEPLGALDLGLRRQMQGELRDMQQRTGITFIAVTHDQEEALAMSNRIAVMHNGRIEQLDTPEAIFDRPGTPFVASFMGANVVSAAVVGRDGATSRVRIGQQELTLPVVLKADIDALKLAIRPERIRLGDPEGWPAEVIRHEFTGAATTVHLRLRGELILRASVPHSGHHHLPGHGESTTVHFSPEDLMPLSEG